MQKSYAVAKFSCSVVSAIAFMARPVIAFLAFSTNLVLRLLGMKTEAEEEGVTEEDIRMMIDLGKEKVLLPKMKMSGFRMFLIFVTPLSCLP